MSSEASVSPGALAQVSSGVAGKHDPFDQVFAGREVFEDLEVGVAHPQEAGVFGRCLERPLLWG